MTDPKPAMTMREIRKQLGHSVIAPGTPDVEVLPTAYVASCLPEGHDERMEYTIRVEYRGRGKYVVRYRLKYADADGAWDCDPNFDEDDAAEEQWRKAHYFGLTDALRLARQLAPTLTYHGRTVADVLAEAVQS
ncbi:hypothetical protein ACWGNN_00720 [Streptomyces sp. NPDC055817]